MWGNVFIYKKEKFITLIIRSIRKIAEYIGTCTESAYTNCSFPKCSYANKPTMAFAGVCFGCSKLPAI